MLVYDYFFWIFWIGSVDERDEAQRALEDAAHLDPNVQTTASTPVRSFKKFGFRHNGMNVIAFAQSSGRPSAQIRTRDPATKRSAAS
jgi:hypothetical protein